MEIKPVPEEFTIDALAVDTFDGSVMLSPLS